MTRFAWRLALKQREKVTQQWPVTSQNSTNMQVKIPQSDWLSYSAVSAISVQRLRGCPQNGDIFLFF